LGRERPRERGVCRATALPPCPLPHTALHFRTSGKERIMSTPEEIVNEVLEDTYGGGTRYAEPNRWDEAGLTLALARGDVDESAVRELILRAIEIDREQRSPLEDWAHNVAALMAEDKSNDWREEIAQLMAITGEADARIAELTAAWEDAVNYGETGEHHARAADYALSEDDWRAGLSDDEAAEITRLIEWR